MEQLNQIRQYDEFKEALDKEFTNAAESFVRIGYLLKVARDTDILYNSGYKSVTEFARAEYNITPDMVSRYIKINDRFSVNGYGQQLRENMKGYGIAKLQIMLTLSDEVIGAIPRETTKAELQQIQREIKTEQEKTDIEVMLEASNNQTGSPLEQFVMAFFHEQPGIYEKAYENIVKAPVLNSMLDAVAPSGIAMLMVRIPGTGKLMLSIKGAEQSMELVNIRTNEKRTYEPICLVYAFKDCFIDDNKEPMNAKDRWCEVFSEEFPVKETIAPVQPPKETPREEARKPQPERTKELPEKQEEPEQGSKNEAAPQPVPQASPQPEKPPQEAGSQPDNQNNQKKAAKEEKARKPQEEDGNKISLQWHDYFYDKPEKNGEYIVTETTEKNERKVSVRCYDVINDLWGYRVNATREGNRVWGQVEAWMEKPEPWERRRR